MITYTWQVLSMSTLPNIPNQPEYVVLVNGVLLGTNENNISAFVNWNVQLVVEQNQPDYIPYNQLTQEIVIGWVQEILGQQGINNLESNINGQIESIVNPPVVPSQQPLPWAN